MAKKPLINMITRRYLLMAQYYGYKFARIQFFKHRKYRDEMLLICRWNQFPPDHLGISYTMKAPYAWLCDYEWQPVYKGESCVGAVFQLNYQADIFSINPSHREVVMEGDYDLSDDKIKPIKRQTKG